MMDPLTLKPLRAWLHGAVAAVATCIREAGDDPAEYVRTTYEVSERAYGAWPSAVRRQFEPARTMKLARPRYTIEAVRAEVA